MVSKSYCFTKIQEQMATTIRNFEKIGNLSPESAKALNYRYEVITINESALCLLYEYFEDYEDFIENIDRYKYNSFRVNILF